MTNARTRTTFQSLSGLFLLAASVSGTCQSEVAADTPGIPRTVDLGPGNEAIEARLEGNILSYKQNPTQEEWARTRLDLSGRDLRRMRLHLRLDVLHNIGFVGADLTGADIRETGFVNCSFRNAKLRRVYVGSAIHPDCELTDADISGSYLRLTKAQLQATKNYKQQDLASTAISGDFSGVSFAEFDLRGTVFYLCDLEGCDFENADIQKGVIWGHRKYDERFPQQPPVLFAEDQLYATKSYRDRNLTEVMFIGCDFRGVDFAGQSLGVFRDCDLREANFQDASFFGSSYHTWHFQQTGDRECGLYECELSPQQFYSTRLYMDRRLPKDFILHSMDLSGWDFSGFELGGASFNWSSMKGADLTDARGGDFRLARDLTVEQVKSMWNYKNDRLDEPGFVLPDYIIEALQSEEDLAEE